MKPTKRDFFGVIIFILIAVLNGCMLEYEEPVEPVKVIAQDGLTIQNDRELITLENTDLESVEAIDTTVVHGQKFVEYNLVVSGESVETIKPGTVIINPEGRGSVMVVTEVDGGIQKSTNSLAGTNRIFAKAKTATLDLLFNYEKAIVQFSTKENRAKRALDIPGKLYDHQIQDDKDKFEIETNGELGLSYDNTDDLVHLLFNGAKFKLKPKNKDNDNEFSASLTINEGYLKFTPAMDFLMEYNPRYLEKSDNEWINYAEWFNPGSLAGKAGMTVGTMKRLRVVTYADLDYGIDVELEIEGKLQEIYEKKIAQWCHIFPAGPVPIGLQTTISFEVDLSATGSLTSRYYNMQEHNILLGFDLQRELGDDGAISDDVTYYQEYSSEVDKGLSFTAEIEFAAGITLKIKEEVYVVGVLGPSVSAGAKLEAYMRFWNSTRDKEIAGVQVGLDAMLIANATLDLSLFHLDFATWNILASKDFETKPLSLYKYPDHLKLLSQDNLSGNVGQMLSEPIRIGVMDSEDSEFGGKLNSVPVYFEAGETYGYNGTISPDSPVKSNDGVSTVNWQLDSKVGLQKLRASLLDSDGDYIGEPVTIKATASGMNIDPPLITSIIPVNGTSGVDVSSPIEITYSKDIYFTPSATIPSLSGGIARLLDSDFNDVGYRAEIVSGNKIVITPYQPLKGGESYSLRVNSGVVHDNSGSEAEGTSQDIHFSTLDESGLTVEIKDILPQEILDIIEEMDITINGGNDPPEVENTYLVTPYKLFKSNIPNDNVGNLFGDLTIKFYDQNPRDLSIRTKDKQATTTGAGSGSFIVGEGNKFTIVGEDIRRESDNTLRCKLAFVISGEIVSGGIKDYHHTIIMVDDYGDPNGNLIEIGQLRELYDSDGFSGVTDDLLKSATKSAGAGKAMFEK